MVTTLWAAVHETHSGVVVLLGDRAYKLKKPVDLGFLDFTTAASRAAACDRELQLNRRMAPDVYLGLGSIRAPDATDEPVVVMRRMPEEARLSTLVAAGAPVAEPLRALARALAVFHALATPHPTLQREASRDRVRDRWYDSIDQVRGLRLLDADDVERVAVLVTRYLDGRFALFERRIAEARVVDGHGDLLADDVFCLDDGPRALDCLDFDDRLRHVDGLDDAATLAMDVERLGSPAAAASFLASYTEFSGDPAPSGLCHHYVAYRAFVRAKVACLRSAQGDPDAIVTARALLALTLRHLRLGEVRLILVGGLPGTGKSTVAGGIADTLGGVLLSSDRIRKTLAGIAPQTPSPSGYREDLYAPAMTDATYTEVLRRAESLLDEGEAVVLDASWTDARHRLQARDLARTSCARIVELRCIASTEVAAERIRRRGPGPSDADPDTSAAMAADADPWPEAHTIDTRRPIDRTIASAVAVVGAER